MIERVCRGLEEVGLLDSSCIVTHRSQVEITRKSVGAQVPLLAEPQKRGTFTASSSGGELSAFCEGDGLKRDRSGHSGGFVCGGFFF